MTASFADQEIWHVLVASDDMKRMNVEQLDDAFRLSLVDASTMVWKAGMQTWQRLGSVAGIEADEEESETVTKQMNAEALAQMMRVPPPPPPPIAAPQRARSLPPSPPRPAPVAAFQTQQFAAPLVSAPMYVPRLAPPDPYVLPKRRAMAPSEVNFRRRSGGVRAGRWLVALLLLTTGVLACYRQNLLRDGAKRLGLENKYLYGEKRVTAFVAAKAPKPVQNALTRLALLPGPNAVAPAAAAPEPRAPEPQRAPEPASSPIAAKSSAEESDVKTVSLDSLPVLGTESDASESEPTPTERAASKSTSAAPPPVARAKVAPAPRKATARAQADDEPAPKPKKAEPKARAKAEPKVAAKPRPEPKPVSVPPSANEGFLKAAIRSAIADDAAKGK